MVRDVIHYAHLSLVKAHRTHLLQLLRFIHKAAVFFQTSLDDATDFELLFVLHDHHGAHGAVDYSLPPSRLSNHDASIRLRSACRRFMA